MITEEQKARRRLGVGGSEVAALVGMNPYMRPIDVYEAKVHGRDVPDNQHMERGRFFEKPTAEWRVHRYGGRLVEVDTIQSKQHPLILVHPDFIVAPAGDPAANLDYQNCIDLSIKVPGPRTWGQWGEDGSDECPTQALIQLQYELIPLGELYGINRGEVCAPIDGDLRRFPMVSDRELQAMLIDAVERFWRDHVLPQRPPSPDGSNSYSEFIRRRYPENSGPLLRADFEGEAWAEQLFRARAAMQRAEMEAEEARQQLELLIGAGDGIEGEGWRITWRRTKGTLRTDWEAVAQELGAPQAVVEKHTRLTNGSRRFLPTQPKKKGAKSNGSADRAVE